MCVTNSPSCTVCSLSDMLTGCTGASDATYHIMWIVVFNALDDFGIRELNDVVRAGSPDNEHPNYSNIETIKKKVSDDAIHGALRIAGLVRIIAMLQTLLLVFIHNVT